MSLPIGSLSKAPFRRRLSSCNLQALFVYKEEALLHLWRLLLSADLHQKHRHRGFILFYTARMDQNHRFFYNSTAQESAADPMQFAFSSPSSRSTSSIPSSSSIYEDRENIDPVTRRSALTGRRVLDREEPSVSGSGLHNLVDAESSDLPQSRSPLPENYPRIPLQDITAVLEQVGDLCSESL